MSDHSVPVRFLFMRVSLTELLHNRFSSWIVLGASLLLTLLAWQVASDSVQRRADERFLFEQGDAVARIVQRMQGYEQVLLGAVALFDTLGRKVTREEWRRYVAMLQTERRYPGIQGLGFSLMLKPGEVAAHVAEVCAEGYADYRIHPEGARELYSSIVYLEPLLDRNLRAFGYDMFSEPTRRQAMEQARDAGRTVVSGRVVLVQETDQDVQFGFLMYLPVYRWGLPVATTEERRLALLGFVYSPFRMNDLMQGILGQESPEVEFELYDGLSTNPAQRLYRSHQSPAWFDRSQVAEVPIQLPGRQWMASFTTSRSFVEHYGSQEPTLIAIGGVMVDILLFIMIVSMTRQWQRLEAKTAQLLASEEQLQDREARHRAVTELALDGFLVLDQAGKILDVNQSYIDRSGYARHELIQCSMMDLDVSEGQDKLDERLRRIRDQGAEQFESWHRHRSGELWPVEISVTYWTSNEGCFFVFIRDVSEHHRVESEKNELIEALRFQRDRSPLPIILLDLRGIITYWNAAAELVFGYQASAIVGQPLVDTLVVEPSRPIMYRLVERLKQGDLDANGLIENHTLDGQSKLCEWFNTPLRASSGAVSGLLCVVVDITEQRQTEQALMRAKDDAEQANHAKSQFLANMSHEIRTPLNAILGLAQLVMDTGMTARQQDYLQKILSSSQTLLGILNDILDYSKIEAGRLEIEQVPFDLENLIQTTANLFQLKAQSNGLQLFSRIDPELPATLIGDALRLGQVLNNLVGNAVKFTEQGEVNIEVTGTGDDGYFWLEFRVCDTGVGLTAEQLDTLFQPFSQADISITRRYGGSGLGLAISQRLVHLMGGHIKVISAVGQGSQFHFSVPCTVARVSLDPTQLQPLQGLRLLWTSPATAEDEALKKQVNAWNLHFTDVALPDQAYECLREAEQLGQPFGLVMTGWDGPNWVHTLMAAALSGALRRPPQVVQFCAVSEREALWRLFRSSSHQVRLLARPVTAEALFNALVHVHHDHQGQIPVVVGRKLPPELSEALTAVRGSRILLVEDNELNQQVAMEFLDKMGFAVRLAAHGVEALDLMFKHDFDLVLMDLQMPEMDGLEAARRIRQLPQGKVLPIIAMTAAAMRQDREACMQVGMNDFLAKPVAMGELLRVLLRWLRPDQSIPEARLPAFPELDIPAELPAWPGFEVALAVQRMGGDFASYARAAHIFLRNYQDLVAQLHRHLDTGDFSALAALLHRLKGEAGQLGATELQERAIAAEGAAKNADDGVLLGMIEQMLPMLESVKGYFEALPEPARVSFSTPPAKVLHLDELRERLLALEEPLLRNKLVVVHLFDELLQAAKGSALESRLMLLDEAIRGLRFKEAATRLRELLQEQGWR